MPQNINQVKFEVVECNLFICIILQEGCHHWCGSFQRCEVEDASVRGYRAGDVLKATRIHSSCALQPLGGEENKVNSPFSTAQQQALGLAWQLCENAMQPFSPHVDEKSTPI